VWPAWWRWLVVAADMAALFVASSRSALPELPGLPSDKLLHGAAYAVLGGLIIWAATRGRWWRATARLVLAAALACVIYGVTDELHQAFVPARTPSAGDLAADALGGFAAAGASWAWGIISRGGDRRDAV
jgi:VanZ family protein